MTSRLLPLMAVLVAGCVTFSLPARGSELVLIPIGGTREPINGAFGSKWVVEEYARNTGTTPVDFIFPNCPTAFCGFTFRPGATERNALYPYGVYWLSGSNTDQIHFSVVVRDISRQNESWGVEVPAVRERELRADRLELIRVPTDTLYRRNLRLYAVWPDGKGGTATLQVRVYDAAADHPDTQEVVPRLLGEREFFLNGQEGIAPGYVGFASVDIDDLFAGSNTDAVRIVVERVAGTPKLWAFMTLTNNVTQHFTTITP